MGRYVPAMRRLLSISVWSTILLAGVPAVVHAQPDVRDHRDHHKDREPPAAASWPTEAPPPSREEKVEAAKAGEAWVKGRWNWKDGKYDWMPGHWERERAGKHWREARWEQKNGHYELTEGGWDDGGGAPGPAAGAWPTEAPPPSREEKVEAAKAGELWVKGRWNWKDGKYDWMPGHWERERAGKHWREARWEQKDGHYALIEGDWEDGAAAAPPAPPTERDHRDEGRGDGDRPHKREWKLERPVVSSYWPTKGKIGQRVVVRGHNFPTDASVRWGDLEIKGAKVTPDEIVFEVPAGATSGGIGLRMGHGRDLSIGAFEVAAGYDADAERKRFDDERRKQAEAAWAGQQAKFAKDRAARQADVDRRDHEREGSRDQRHRERFAEIKAKWDVAFLADPDTQAELTLHAQRVAQITRMHDIAEINGDAKLGARINAASDRETARHDARMAALHDSFGHNGGAK